MGLTTVESPEAYIVRLELNVVPVVSSLAYAYTSVPSFL